MSLIKCTNKAWPHRADSLPSGPGEDTTTRPSSQLRSSSRWILVCDDSQESLCRGCLTARLGHRPRLGSMRAGRCPDVLAGLAGERRNGRGSKRSAEHAEVAARALPATQRNSRINRRGAEVTERRTCQKDKLLQMSNAERNQAQSREETARRRGRGARSQDGARRGRWAAPRPAFGAWPRAPAREHGVAQKKGRSRRPKGLPLGGLRLDPTGTPAPRKGKELR